MHLVLHSPFAKWKFVCSIWSHWRHFKPMKLSSVERERLTDSVLKIQSIRASLDQMDEQKIPKLEEMESCLKGVDHGLRKVLGYAQREADRPDPGMKNSD